MIPVVDVFAGPGGLNEGFSNLRIDGNHAFQTAASFEMDERACATLTLRAALRVHERAEGGYPSSYYRMLRGEETYAEYLSRPDIRRLNDHVAHEVHQIELGPTTRGESDQIIRAALPKGDGAWVLVGGPPCQAYSLVGRSRRAHDATFADDHKHYLFREYLHILERHQPPVFVMENVKGLLSATNKGTRMFDLIVSDLKAAGYEIRSLVVAGEADSLRPTDFVIRSERYGIPQQRHRVILLGIRSDLAAGQSGTLSAEPFAPTVSDAIRSLPPIRSAISPRGLDNQAEWQDLFETAQIAARKDGAASHSAREPLSTGGAFLRGRTETDGSELLDWLVDPKLRGFIQHESRAHMASDLLRYGYMSAMTAQGKRVRVHELPRELLPAHSNLRAAATPFSDRFRVQKWDAPSSTVVSHISKDGHYFIHPDPTQMRSLSVREAARLQTFPDNYRFAGARTQQFHQVGNAVPPLLANKIAGIVARFLGVGVGR